VHFERKGEASVSKKKADPEFVPEVIEDDAPELMAAFVPSQIEAGDGYDPRLIGFPLNILSAGITDDGQQSVVSVCYEPAPETLREDPERKEMCYFTKPKNGHYIRVIFEKSSGRWLTKKFKGRKLIRTAFGSTYDQAMMQTTLSGLEAGEPW
jgi:hypothetical protein